MNRPALTRDRILTTALALADAEGLEAVTMRRVALLLSVEAMSLYHHVANKERLIDGLVDVVFAEIVPPPAELPWRQSLSVRTASAHQVLRQHRWAPALMESRAHPGLATLAHHNAVLGCLRRGGFTVAQAAQAISVLDAHLYGFALQQNSLPFQSPEEVAAVAEQVMAQFPAERFPFLAELMVEHALKPGYDYEQEFQRGLDLVLDGLERLVGRGTQP